MLEMMWHCDVCHEEGVCDVLGEMQFFGLLLMAKRNHERTSPSCQWKIRVRLFPPAPYLISTLKHRSPQSTA